MATSGPRAVPYRTFGMAQPFLGYSKGHFEWLLLERADAQHREAQDIALRIHLFHHLIVRRLAEVPRLLIESDFKIVALGVVQTFSFLVAIASLRA